MTVQGILVLTLIGLVFLFWILNLVRRDRLYVGYGVMFVLLICAAIVVLAVPSLLAFITNLVGAIFPASALTLIALCFIAFMLVYILTQVTLLSNRVAAVVQQIAIQQAKEAAAVKSAREDDGGGAVKTE